MKQIRLLYFLLALLAAALPLSLFLTRTAHAAPRTFVASTGNDANACTRTAPCRTFPAAITQADPGGEVIVLDAGGYGPITGAGTITKSVSLICPAGVYAGITVPVNGTGVTVNAGTNDTVTLRGILLNGLGVGQTGISFLSGKSLVVDNCIVDGFTIAGVSTTAPGNLVVKNSSVRRCVAQSNIGVGVVASSNNSSAPASAYVDNCDFVGNDAAVFGAENSRIVVRNSPLTANHYGAYAVGSTGNLADITLFNCAVTHNSITGLYAYTYGTIRIARSVVAYNTTGLSFVTVSGQTTGQILTQKNNLVEGNTTQGSFTADPGGTLANK